MNIGGAAAKKVYDAASRGEVARFQQLLDEDPYLVDGASFTCSRNLLHIAILCGQAGIVEAVLKISPRLARSLDSQNWSPLHIASAEGNLEIARKLLTVAPEMCWSRDCQGMNPIHIAAMKGHVEILHELVELDSLPAMERVHRGQTVLHLCVKHRQLRAFEFLVEEMAREFVSAKDDDGDTVLHWAVRSNQVEMVRCLVTFNKIEKLARNSMGKIALSILTMNSRDTSNNYFRIRTMLTSWSTKAPFGFPPDMAGMIMVVVALIATMAYQTAVNPPGGFWHDDSSTHKAGEAVMASTNPTIYTIFLLLNGLAFVSCFITIFLLSTGLLFENSSLQGYAMYTMWLSIMFIAVTYQSSLIGVISPNSIFTISFVTVIGIVLLLVSITFILFLFANGYQSNAPAWNMRRRSRQQEDVRDDAQLALSPQLNPPLGDHAG